MLSPKFGLSLHASRFLAYNYTSMVAAFRAAIPGCLSSTEAPVMTPNGVDFSFLFFLHI